MNSRLARLAAGTGVAAILLLGGLSTYVYHELGKEIPEDQLFTIEPGTNLSAITYSLVNDAGLKVDDTVFKAAVLLTQDEGPVQAGQYQLRNGMQSLEVISLFRSGKVVQHRVTFPEGLRLVDWLAKLRELPYLRYETPKLTRAQIALALSLDGDVEGWLFPDTYQYILGDSDLDILRMSVARMKDVLDEEWQGRAVTRLSSRYDALILASIIEKETGFEPDREKISSVFHNRLEQGMKLQSDPTVIYGLDAAFDGDLTRAHLRADTLYNTYTRAGLPPTPICSPGRASIKAALAGSAHPYLYFVAKGDGQSHFSLTLQEHNQAVNRYQRK